MKKKQYATYVKYPSNKRFHRVTGAKITKDEAEHIAKVFKNAAYAPKGTKTEVRKIK